MARRIAVLVLALTVAAAVGYAATGGVADRRLRLPDVLPADLPVPEGTILRMARDLGSKGLNLAFESGEPVATVEAQMRARLAAQGWALLSEVALEGAVFTSYRKDVRSVALGVSSKGGVTLVGLTLLGPEPQQEGIQG